MLGKGCEYIMKAPKYRVREQFKYLLRRQLTGSKEKKIQKSRESAP